MLLVAVVRKAFWPAIDWTVAIVDAFRVLALLSAGAMPSRGGSADR